MWMQELNSGPPEEQAMVLTTFKSYLDGCTHPQGSQPDLNNPTESLAHNHHQ